MKVLIDTSAWVNFLGGTETEGSRSIEQVIELDFDIVACGPVVMELIQGCRTEKEVLNVRMITSNVLYADTDEMLYERSAMLYRQLRNRGVTIRKSIDCLIAVIAIEHDLVLLTDDRDFRNISKYSPLRLYDRKEF